MNVNKKLLRDFLLFWAIIFAIFLFVYQYRVPNPIVRERLERIEAFQTKSAPVEPSILETMTMEPDSATLESPRQPYSLLKDMLPLSTERISPTSQRCYTSDFQTRIEKTGNFRQLTNNYKRNEPDSCSSPLHEFVLSFYKPVVLN